MSKCGVVIRHSLVGESKSGFLLYDSFKINIMDVVKPFIIQINGKMLSSLICYATLTIISCVKDNNDDIVGLEALVTYSVFKIVK